MKLQSYLVLLDIEKAFDSVWHDGLIFKLQKLKFSPFLLKMIQSFLEDRQAFVEVNQAKSSFFDIPAGVPQGSVLSPFLFNIYINDAPKINNCNLAIYADDTALFCDFPWRDINNIKSTLENGLSKITDYFTSWKIKINNSKAEFSIFTRSTIMKNKMNSIFPQFNGNTFHWKKSCKIFRCFT
jgi:hypothetical protein